MSRRLDARKRRRSPSRACAAALAIGLVGLLACSAGDPQPAAAPRRVVLILIDTLRADHLATYGYPHDTAPFLGRLAAAGSVFDRAHSTSSWTAPSTASLMTGLYPTRHGVVEGFFAHRQRAHLGDAEGRAVQPLRKLPTDVPLLAERFRDAGYRTFGAASNINIGPTLGFERGFERFVHAQNEPAARVLERVGGWAELSAPSGERSLLYLHLNDVHSPYERRARWLDPAHPSTDPDIPAYDSEIGYVDHHLSELAQRLGWDDETLVVVLSDHGEEFGDHGGRRHDAGLHEELTRVVLFFSGAGIARRRVEADVSLVDVLPTLLELCGIGSAGGSADALDGRSLVPLLRGDDAQHDAFAERPLLAHRAKMGRAYGGHWWAVMLDGWKLIVDGEQRALYDKRLDRRETRDLSASEPERVRALEAQLDALRASGIRGDGEQAEVVLDEAMVEALEALGYVDAPDAGRAEPEPSESGHE